MFLDVNVDVNKLVEQMKEIVGPMATKGYELAVKQAYVEGFLNLGLTIFFALLVATGISVGIQFFQRADYEQTRTDKHVYSSADGDGWVFAGIVVIVIAILVMIPMVLCACTAFFDLMNPEWRAINLILGR